MAQVKNNGVLKSVHLWSFQGFSLVELMISLALSSGLILGVITVYVNSKSTSELSVSLARIQEAGRVATDIMARDIRMVGFQGCAGSNATMNILANNVPVPNIPPPNPPVPNPPPTGFERSTLRGWEVTTASWANGEEFDNTVIETAAVLGSDVIAIQHAEMLPLLPIPTQTTADMLTPAASIPVAGALAAFDAGDVALISNCESIDLFRITNDPGGGLWTHGAGNTSPNLSLLYDMGSDIMRFVSTVYYVGDTGRQDGEGNAIFALYRQRDNLVNSVTPSFTQEELVQGVESIQILYGQRLANGNVRYLAAGAAGLNMSQVVAVKIGLLISHAAHVRQTVDTASYQLPGQIITSSGGAVTHPEDYRIRRPFELTVALRNRLPPPQGN